MGVVYKAEDTKLGRTVALKFLSEQLVRDPESLRRFECEAKAAATLSHPNVCTVHEIDTCDGQTFLALEHIEGESLDARISAGPMPLQEALTIGRQIAEGLEAAHAKRIVHRDIKPGNVLVTSDGHVKILDFGLALLTEGSKLTKLDTTVGTVAYMSPEQAEGGEVDHRTDLWALGCVLYEMVAGVRPFTGQYDQALLYEIVNQEHEPLTGVRASVPMELEVFVGKCLEKEAGKRYASARDLATDLANVADKLKSGRSKVLPKSTVEKPVVFNEIPARNRKHEFIWQAAAALLLVLLVGSLFFKGGNPPAEVPVRSFVVDTGLPVDTPAISPNGRYIAFDTRSTGDDRLIWLHDLRTGSMRALTGTDGGVAPFWSPDSISIGFGVGTTLKKVSIQDNVVMELASLASVVDRGTWHPDGGSILVGVRPEGGLWKIPAVGGTPELLLGPNDDLRPATPQYVGANGKSLGLIFRQTPATNMMRADIYAQREGSEEHFQIANGALFSYAPSGFLFYVGGSRRLLAVPLSKTTLAPTGDAFPIAQGTSVPSVSSEGSLVYRQTSLTANTLTWRDREGRRLDSEALSAVPTEAVVLSPTGGILSRDESKIAVTENRPSRAIWVYDLSRSVRTRLSDSTGRLPVWSPDGKQVAFQQRGSGPIQLIVKDVDGGTPARIVRTQSNDNGPIACDWSPNGRYLLFQAQANNDIDLWYSELDDKGDFKEATLFLDTPFADNVAQFSPDGRYVAYCSDETGQIEVYVRPFPQGDQRWTISIGGGTKPRWSRDGTELYYVQHDTLKAVAISLDPEFRAGATQELFTNAGLYQFFARQTYDVSSDGRFLMRNADGPGGGSRIRVIQNWQAAFAPE